MAVTATVLGYDGERMRVAVTPEAVCAACSEGRGCGMGLLRNPDREPRTLELRAPCQRPAVGSTVTLGATPGVAAAALAGYGLPLSGILAGAVAGPAAAAAGFAAGLLVARHWARHRVAWRLLDGSRPDTVP